MAAAQQAQPVTDKPATAAAAAAAPAPEVKAPPALPAGSTAAVGWNNPPNWSEVQGKPQYASVPGHETNVLVQDSGQWWRTLRNGPVTFYGGILLLVAPALLLVLYMVKGPFKLHDKPTGRLIERFNSAERMAHWTMAISFVLMAITGMSILWGKYVLLPVIGSDLFSWFTTIGKNIHNFVGPLFIFSIIVSFFIYVKDNFFTAGDFKWLAKFGGMFGEHEVPSGRFNGGEKVWFWLGVVLMGAAIGASGLIMLFPNWNSARELMAEANLVHATAAVLFACMAFAHIYLGIATEGAYQGMREGHVDETWAREHHALWYEEVKAGKVPARISAAAQPAAGDD
jgi:formate dehydrogenase subunit gamma